VRRLQVGLTAVRPVQVAGEIDVMVALVLSSSPSSQAGQWFVPSSPVVVVVVAAFSFPHPHVLLEKGCQNFDRAHG
jgi:hypothetical protein